MVAKQLLQIYRHLYGTRRRVALVDMRFRSTRLPAVDAQVRVDVDDDLKVEPFWWPAFTSAIRKPALFQTRKTAIGGWIGEPWYHAYSYGLVGLENLGIMLTVMAGLNWRTLVSCLQLWAYWIGEPWYHAYSYGRVELENLGIMLTVMVRLDWRTLVLVMC